MVKAVYEVNHVDFIMPDFDMSKKTFEQGLGLKPISIWEKGITYQLNEETSLFCEIDPDKGWYDTPKNRLSLYTSTSNILVVMKRLKRLSKDVKISIWETEDKKKKVHHIAIPVGINAIIKLTDRLCKDKIIYFPNVIPRSSPHQTLIPLQEALYNQYKKKIKAKYDPLSLDEIQEIFLISAKDFLSKTITIKEFSGLCDELTRQFNEPINKRIYLARSYIDNNDTLLLFVLGRGFNLFFSKDERRKEDLEQVIKYVKAHNKNKQE